MGRYTRYTEVIWQHDRSMTDYTKMFANHDEASAKRLGTARIIRDLVAEYFQISSAIDVGCGKGFLLRAFSEIDVSVRGIEGQWIEDAGSYHRLSDYIFHDLENPLKKQNGDKYDLCASLEVAEHLSPERGGKFVAELCELSDVVLFSAAIPTQRGFGHVNCRWQGEWAEDFARRGFRCYDPFRDRLAVIPDIMPWFAQNLLLFVQADAHIPDALACHEIQPKAASYVRPFFFDRKIGKAREKIRRLKRELQRQTR